MPTIERAVIIAAGEGRRLRPVTLDMPKPLLPVRGVRFIDTIIGALHSNGIHEIYVVTGYLAEQYASLPAQYPGVTLLHNPDYASCNNISSAYVARAHLANAIVSEADLLVQNPAIFDPSFARSCYCAFPGTSPTEWSLTLNNEGTVIRCETQYGHGSHELIGVSFWTAEDGRRLADHLEAAFMREQIRDCYWDELALFRYAADYRLGIREIEHADIREIDTLADLASADPIYGQYLPQQ